ncbi:MAG TPA: serine hydrolase [Chitinophagaceae bacterium]|jgi:CubicO group peptidase (beta-lactamase class C family)|nr:serine hydrolase [Chitinophagaceae bacterium]
MQLFSTLRKGLLIACCSLFIANHSFSQQPKFITDSLDKYIEAGLKRWEIPGLAIAIVKDGKVIVSKGYGVRETGKKETVDENTLFIIASNSKLFTGTSIAKLDHEQKLSLNDRVTKYIPWFRLYDSTSTKLATVRDVLCHRLGTKTFQGDFTFWDSNLAKDSIIWKMRYLKPTGEFRQDYGYCNSGFLVAGEILSKVTGQSWENYVQDNILSPLGMSNTYMNTAGLANRNNVAQPHNNLCGPLSKIPFDNVDNLGPATSMVSNVKDITKWLMLQLDSGKYQGKQVLPWSVLQRTRDINILTGSRKSAAFPTHFRGYGLGVYSTDYNGRQVYWHTGGAFGHVTNICFVPEEGLGITILTNNDNQSFFEALRYQILDAYLGVNYTNRSLQQWGFFVTGKRAMEQDLNAMQTRVGKHAQPELKLEDYTGEYFNTVYGKITITKKDNQLICRFQHHPDLIGTMDYMDKNAFRVTYSNIGYGIYPANFSVKDGKAVAVTIKANDFVESDAYLFVKDPAGIVVK